MRKLLYKFSNATLALVAALVSLQCVAHADSVSVILSCGSKILRGETCTATVTTVTQRKIIIVNLSTSLGKVTNTGANDSNPAHFMIKVGPETPLGSWTIKSYVTLDNGVTLESAPANISVESDISYPSIFIFGYPSKLSYIGESGRVEVFGSSSRDPKSSLLSSKRLTIRSLDNNVVIWESDSNRFYATGPGNTALEATYTDEHTGETRKAQYPITVRVPLKGDFNGDNQVDIDDWGTLWDATRQAHHTLRPIVANDGRDLNGDGVIDWKDFPELEKLCGYPNCNFRPIGQNEATPTPLFVPTWAPPTPTPRPTATPTGTPVTQNNKTVSVIGVQCIKKQTYRWKISNPTESLQLVIYSVPKTKIKGKIRLKPKSETYLQTKRLGKKLKLAFSGTVLYANRVTKCVKKSR